MLKEDTLLERGDIMKISENLKKAFEESDIVRTYPKGSFLYREGDFADKLFFIKNGKIQVSKAMPDGRELILRICSSESIVGEFFLFTTPHKHILNAVVLEECTVSILCKDDLEQKLSIDQPIAIELIQLINLEYRKTNSMFRDLILHGKKGALYSTLIRLSNSYGQETDNGIFITLPLTNQELANFCGTSREMVNRFLSQLKKDGIISTDHRHIIIHDIKFLKNEIECENCPIEICNLH